jgi:hypothetical protein
MVSSPFLVRVGDEPAVVETTGEWSQILDKAKLNANSPAVLSTDGEKDVTVTADSFWGLQFSSTKNETYLGEDEDKLRNHAWVGDELDCTYPDFMWNNAYKTQLV